MARDPLQTLTQQAEKKFRSGEFLAAAEAYHQAERQYAQTGDEPKAAEMANNRSVALLQAGDAQAALDACQDTEQIFARAGDLRSQGMALGNQAAALEALNRPDEALKIYWQSNELLKEAGDHDTRAHVLQHISTLQMRTGRQYEALASMDSALQHKKKLTLVERFLKKVIQVPMDKIRRGG